jgi:hypothetical protein
MFAEEPNDFTREKTMGRSVVAIFWPQGEGITGRRNLLMVPRHLVRNVAALLVVNIHTSRVQTIAMVLLHFTRFNLWEIKSRVVMPGLEQSAKVRVST